MAMGAYRGVNNVARKVTKIYRGVSNVARTVTKGYRGVNNVARQFFSNGTYLYKSGDQCTSLTGGYSTRNGGSAISINTNLNQWWKGSATLNINSNNLSLYIPHQNYSSENYNNNVAGLFHTKNKINLTNYSKLIVEADATFGTTDAYDLHFGFAIFLATNNITWDEEGKKYKNGGRQNKSGSVYKHKFVLDVSSLSGSYYLALMVARDENCCASANNWVSVKVYNIWLE